MWRTNAEDIEVEAFAYALVHQLVRQTVKTNMAGQLEFTPGQPLDTEA